jgi:cadmium resistance protein CadD (predicted permease)
MSGADTELALVSLAAMLSPTTVSFSVLALVLGERPLRSGLWFYLGAFSANMFIGVLAAFVLGDAAASHSGGPKTWVAIFDVVAGVFFVLFAGRLARRPGDPAREERMIAKMRTVASSRPGTIVVAGATLANAGAFIPVALKNISQLDPTAAEYVADWTAFTIVSLLPLAVAILLLLVARESTERRLDGVRRWLERHAHTVGAVLVLALGVALMRNGIAGLVS